MTLESINIEQPSDNLEMYRFEVKIKPLPKESLITTIYRKVFKNPRKDDYVWITVNGRSMVIKRGIWTKIPYDYLVCMWYHDRKLFYKEVEYKAIKIVSQVQ